MRHEVDGNAERGGVLPGDAPDGGEDAARRGPAGDARAVDGAAVDARGGAGGHDEHGGRRRRAGLRAPQEPRGRRAHRRDRPDQEVCSSAHAHALHLPLLMCCFAGTVPACTLHLLFLYSFGLTDVLYSKS